jgi:hypothetical protein
MWTNGTAPICALFLSRFLPVTQGFAHRVKNEQAIVVRMNFVLSPGISPLNYEFQE